MDYIGFSYLRLRALEPGCTGTYYNTNLKGVQVYLR